MDLPCHSRPMSRTLQPCRTPLPPPKHGPSNTTLPTASIRGPPLIRLMGTRRHPETPPQRDSGLRASLTTDLEELPTPLANKSPGLSDSVGD